jgi:uncharacterized protein
VRLVADGAGRVKVDHRRRLSGRGAYLHADESCVGESVRKQALARSFRRKVVGVELAGLWSEIRRVKSESTVKQV